VRERVKRVRLCHAQSAGQASGEFHGGSASGDSRCEDAGSENAAGYRGRGFIRTAGDWTGPDTTAEAAGGYGPSAGACGCGKACRADHRPRTISARIDGGERGDGSQPGSRGEKSGDDTGEELECVAAGSCVESARFCGQRARSDAQRGLGTGEKFVQEGGGVVGAVGRKFVSCGTAEAVPTMGL
jgi:hypothetical protein